MKTIIAGSRTITDYDTVRKAVEASGFAITEVVCGMARGADLLGKRWGMESSIPVKEFPADWDGKGRYAGYDRNIRMAEYADALVAVWDGSSKGTSHMINAACKLNLKVFVYRTDGSPL